MSSPLSSPYDSQNHINDSSATGTPTNNFMKHASGASATNGGVNNNRKQETIYLKRLHLFYYNG